MPKSWFNRAGLAALGATLLAGCAAVPKPVAQAAAVSTGRAAALTAEYSQLAAAHPSEVYAINAKASTIRIYVFRGGAAARAGHDHVLAAPEFTGYAYAPDGDLSAARFDLEFRLDELQLDDPALRRATGGVFAAPLSADDVAATRRHMLGPRSLDAARHPWLEVRSLAVIGDAPAAAAQVAITLHGVTREQAVALRIVRRDHRLSVRGALVLRQTDFGITPYSVLGGLLAVQDPVVVEFRLVGEAIARRAAQ